MNGCIIEYKHMYLKCRKNIEGTNYFYTFIRIFKQNSIIKLETILLLIYVYIIYNMYI